MSKICRSGSWIAAAVMAAGLMGGQVYGADELDQQLGPKDQTMGPPAPTTAPKVNATEKPVTPKVEVRTDTVKAPSENDIVSPDAVKKVDDADLVKDLTGENKGQASADPAVKFKEAIERMGTSEERLKGKDTGEVTQETQRRIVMDLDVLIEIAKKQQQQSSSSSQHWRIVATQTNGHLSCPTLI